MFFSHDNISNSTRQLRIRGCSKSFHMLFALEQKIRRSDNIIQIINIVRSGDFATFYSKF